LADQNAAELRIIAKLVDEASAPLRALKANFEAFGSSGATAEVGQLGSVATTAASEVVKAGESAGAGLTPLVPTAQKVKEGLDAIKPPQIKPAIDDFRAFKGETQGVGETLKVVSSALGKFGVEGGARVAEIGAGAAEASGALSGLAASAGPVAIALGAVAIAGGLVLGALEALKSAGEEAAAFDREFSRVTVLLGTSREETAKLKEEVFSLARAYSLEAKDAVVAFYAAVASGAGTSEEAARVAAVGAKTQAAGFGELTTSISILSDVQDAYASRAGNVEEIGNKIALTASRSATSYAQLATGLASVLPIASQVGVSFDELLGITETLRTSGVGARRTFQTISQALQTLNDPQAREAFAQAGVDVSELRIRGEGLVPILRDIAARFGDNDDELAKITPSLRGLGLLLGAVAGNAGKLDESLKALRENRNYLDNAAAKRLDESFNVLAAGAKSLKEGFNEIFGDTVLNGAADIIRTLKEQKELIQLVGETAKLAAEGLKIYLEVLNGIVKVGVAPFELLAKGFHTVEAAIPESAKTNGFLAGLEKLAEGALTTVDPIVGAGVKFLKLSADIHSAAESIAADAKKIEAPLSALATIRNNAIEGFKDKIRIRIDRGDDINSIIADTNKFAQQLNAVAVPGQEIADSVHIVSEAFDETRSKIVNVNGEVKKLVGIGGDVDRAFAKLQDVDLSKLGPALSVSPFNLSDVQKGVTEALAKVKLPPLEVPFALDTTGADETVRDAFKTLQGFKNSQGFFDIKLVSPDQKAKVEAALKVAQAFVGSLDQAKALADELRIASLRGTEAESAALEQRIAKFAEQIDNLEREGKDVSALRATLVEVRKAGEEDIANGLISDFRGIIEKSNEVDKAAEAAQERVRSTLGSFSKQLLTGFAAERAAVNQTLEDATKQLRELAADPKNKIGAEQLGLDLTKLREVGAELRDALDTREVNSTLDKSIQETIALREEQARGLTGLAGDIANITIAIFKLRTENEKLVRDGLRTPEQGEKFTQAFAKAKRDQQLEVAVRASLVPSVEIDQRAFEADLREKLGPLVDQANAAMSKIGDGFTLDDAKKEIDELNDKMRKTRIEAQNTAAQFNKGFKGGLKDAVDEFTNQAKNAYEVARSSANALSDDLANLIVKATEGKASFKDFAKSVLADLTSILAKSVSRQLIGGFLGLALQDGGVIKGQMLQDGGVVKGAMSAPRAFAAGGVMAGAMMAPTALGNVRAFAQGGVMPGSMTRPMRMPSSDMSDEEMPQPMRRRFFAVGGVQAGEMSAPRAGTSTTLPDEVIRRGRRFEFGGVMPGAMAAPHASPSHDLPDEFVTRRVRTRFFADGGVMPGMMMPSSTMPLRMYASGGVATTPQHAIFAERPGMAEAFVPLPGPNRGIPVEFKKDSTRGQSVNVVVNYTVNALDGASVKQMLESHGRTIGDIAAGQIAGHHNRALVQSVRGVR
jgi:TP901 family phage tail tape measure protein